MNRDVKYFNHCDSQHYVIYVGIIPTQYVVMQGGVPTHGEGVGVVSCDHDQGVRGIGHFYSSLHGVRQGDGVGQRSVGITVMMGVVYAATWWGEKKMIE